MMILKQLFKELSSSLVNFVYPPQCLHCQEGLTKAEGLICTECTSLLELLGTESRCRTCFSPLPNRDLKTCKECRKTNHAIHSVAACFDYYGPAASIIKNLKYFNQPHLAIGAAAFMVAQFSLLDWPIPDMIVPVPISTPRWLDRGYNQSFLLASEISKLLSVPTIEALKRHSGDYSQANLSHNQRLKLHSNSFSFLKKHGIKEKTILLVDDVFTTGSTLKRSAEALCAGYPSYIYGLTFCKTA